MERMTNDLIEELRWTVRRYTLNSPELFEQRRREKWLKPGTRNHGAWEGGIQREERDESGSLEVVDATLPAARALIEGRTIVAFDREADSGQDWSHGENTVQITLDDGAVLTFTGVGYDASGCVTAYSPPESASTATEGPRDE